MEPPDPSAPPERSLELPAAIRLDAVPPHCRSSHLAGYFDVRGPDPLPEHLRESAGDGSVALTASGDIGNGERRRLSDPGRVVAPSNQISVTAEDRHVPLGQ